MYFSIALENGTGRRGHQRSRSRLILASEIVRHFCHGNKLDTFVFLEMLNKPVLTVTQCQGVRALCTCLPFMHENSVRPPGDIRVD